MTGSAADRLDGLYEHYRKAYTDKEVVVGAGAVPSRIMFIGEAPGREEILKGMPFSGRAGMKFEAMLEDLGLDREAIFVTNAIKYGLRRFSEATGRTANRPAKKEEIDENRPYLMEEIDIVGPELIITLGRVPLLAVTGKMPAPVTECAGKPFKTAGNVIFPMLHPAALIYARELTPRFESDVLRLKELIGEMKLI